MTLIHVFVAAIGVALVAKPAWRGFQCLTRARRLLRWRRPSLKGINGQLVTIRGEVLVKKPVASRTLGGCLWHRQVVVMHLVYSKSASRRTLSDVADTAKFSIVIDGREFVIADPPTHVYGTHYRGARSGDRAIYTYWLPVVDHLTVLGRVREKGMRWEIVKDDKVGLIFSTHSAERTALREMVKGGLYLALVGAGLLVFCLMLARLRW